MSGLDSSLQNTERGKVMCIAGRGEDEVGVSVVEKYINDRANDVTNLFSEHARINTLREVEDVYGYDGEEDDFVWDGLWVLLQLQTF